uniref:Uncharacterized protein n=1 Tax=Phytophthora ramorum TaxID=164328 RepID=H3HDY5_PHYRM
MMQVSISGAWRDPTIMDAQDAPKPKPAPLSPEPQMQTHAHNAAPKSPAKSPGSLLKSPSAFEQKPLRMPKPMSI